MFKQALKTMADIKQLEQLATQVRRDILRMVHAVNSGHPGGSMGCTEFFVANNCPPTKRLEIEYYAMLFKSSVHRFYGSNSELGIVCGKIFTCSCLGIIDSGDADIENFLD